MYTSDTIAFPKASKSKLGYLAYALLIVSQLVTNVYTHATVEGLYCM